MYSANRLFGSYKMLASLLALLLSSHFSMAQPAEFVGDAVKGKKVFKKCAVCHRIGADAINSVGPVLNDVVGRTAASFAGYKYGKSIVAAGQKGLNWTPQQLFSYLAGPKDFLRQYLGDPKAIAKMGLSLRAADDRKNVIAYLQTLTVKPQAEADGELAGESAQAEMMLSPQPGKICIVNKSDMALFLTSEIDRGERLATTVAAGGTLCAAAAGEQTNGRVAAFENENTIEGCTRLAKTGEIKILLSYASYDNCAWQ